MGIAKKKKKTAPNKISFRPRAQVLWRDRVPQAYNVRPTRAEA